MARMRSYSCNGLEETMQFAKEFGKTLLPGNVVCLFGDLGAGKTTFVKGLSFAAAKILPEAVNSPTYVYLNIYQGSTTIYHFDLYRLKDADEFLSMGFDEMLFGEGITCIEWSERIKDLLPPDVIKVYIEHRGENKREIRVEP